MVDRDVLIFGTMLVVLVVVVIYYFRPKKSRAPQSPELVLGEVEIFLAYGRKRQAIELLEKGILQFPDSVEIKGKLKELEAD